MRDPWRNYDRLQLESPEDRDERLRKLFAKPDMDDVADYLDECERREERDSQRAIDKGANAGPLD